MKKVLNIMAIILLGSLVGIITGYTRSYHPFSFWAFSDLADKYGFWIISVSIIAICSKNTKNAVLNTCLYMMFMCVFYYGYLYIEKDVLYIKQLILWMGFSVVASIYSGIINEVNNKASKKRFIINAVPLVVLFLELFFVAKMFVLYRTNFMQLIIDIVGMIILVFLFIYKKSKTRQCN